MTSKALAWITLAGIVAAASFWVVSCCHRSPWQGVYDKSDSSVVEIYSATAEGNSLGKGTGFVFQVRDHAVVLTNRHVASRFTIPIVRMRDGEVKAATVLDASELHDMAILGIEGLSLKRYGFLPRGRSINLRIGDEVMTIGHPIQESHHISVGFFTGKHTDDRGRTLLRLSMAVDPGNSGGPLLNSQAQVVGIITQKVSESANIAFAIPIEKVDELQVGL